ncbi:MAG: glycosyltransferase family 2 protein [Roseiflexaceae bacterium]
MQSLPTIWSVIINWKCAEETCVCLASLTATVDPSTVVVIDNGSADGSVELISARFPAVTMLPISTNLGFAKAANIGIAHALARRADGIFLLNNDTTVAPDTVTRLAQQLAESVHVGVLSAKIFLTEQPGRLWSVGGVYRGHNAIDLGAGALDHGQFDHTQLDFVYGCAMLLSARMLYAIGGFDERFFMYYEDVDLCLRARAAGYTVALAPAAHVWHLGSHSTSAKPGLKLFYEARSRQLFYAKHLSGAARRRFYGSEFRYIISLTLQRLRAGNPAGALAYLRGCLAALLG